MAEFRSYLLLLVLFVVIQRGYSSPSFGIGIWCSMFCSDDYYEDDDDGSASLEDLLLYFFDPCGDCESRPAAASTTSSPGTADEPSRNTDLKPQKINLSIPPSNGVNLTLENTGTWWWLNFVPWGGSSSESTTTAAPAAAAETTTPAGNATNATAA